MTITSTAIVVDGKSASVVKVKEQPPQQPQLEAEAEVTTQVATGPESLEKAVELIAEFGLPDGLLPLKDVVECGHDKQTGYVWITQKKPIVHSFKQISKQVSYGEKITAYLEKGRLKKLTGVKAKELLWMSIVDIAVEESNPKNLFFKSFSGLGKTFPSAAFIRGADK